MPKIAVLIPCYNEEKTIAKVIDDHRKSLPEADIYVYNNNSTDKTEEIVQEKMKTDPKLFLKREYRQGKGNVISSMFRDIDADAYYMTDGDDTYPSEYARTMTDMILRGEADMVIGDRLSTTYFEENKRRFHNFGNTLVRKLINHHFKTNINDIMTGQRAFSYDFVKGFPILSKGFEIETEMTIFAIDNNFLVREIPVTYRDRPEGSVSKLNTFSDGRKVVGTVYSFLRYYRPKYYFTILAAAFFLLALILFVPVFIEYLKTGTVDRIPTLIVASIFGVMALLSFFTGILLSFIAKKRKQEYFLFLKNIIHRKT